MSNLNDTFQQIIDTVNNDPNLDDEMRSEILDLAALAKADPTPGNMDALAIVFEKLSDANKYMGAMTALRNLHVDNVLEAQEEEVDSSTQAGQ